MLLSVMNWFKISLQQLAMANWIFDVGNVADFAMAYDEPELN